MAPYDPPPTPADFPDLENASVIAQGTRATLYRAYQRSGGRDVAIKIVNRNLSDDAPRRQRFEQEVRAVARLSSHPSINDTFVAGVSEPGNPYIITALCRGSYFDRVAASGSLPPEDVQDIGIRASDALAVSHEARILHGNIKPTNLLIDRDGRPVLSDFGIPALVDDQPHEPVVRPAESLAYAPLEVFHHRSSGEAADVYSLAATLYALLSGHPPHLASANQELSVDQAVGMFTEPIADVPGVSQVLQGMLRAAMTNNPEGRPSAMQFRDMLESVPVAGATGMIPKVQLPEDQPQAEPSPPPAMPGPPAEAAPLPRRPRPSPSPRPREHTDEAQPPGDSPPARHSAPFGEPPPPPEPQYNLEPFGEVPALDDDPAAVSSSPHDEPTTRRERRIASRGGDQKSGMGPLILVGAIAVAIILAAAIGAFFFLSGDGESASEESAGGDDGASCPLGEYELNCVEETEDLCFDGDLVDDESDMAAAEPVSCDEEHRWEAYASGTLPDDIADPSYEEVSSADVVRDTCLARDAESPLSALMGMGASDWNSNVLPPSEDAFDDGDRTFLCVAEPKNGESTTERL